MLLKNALIYTACRLWRARCSTTLRSDPHLSPSASTATTSTASSSWNTRKMKSCRCVRQRSFSCCWRTASPAAVPLSLPSLDSRTFVLHILSLPPPPLPCSWKASTPRPVSPCSNLRPTLSQLSSEPPSIGSLVPPVPHARTCSSPSFSSTVAWAFWRGDTTRVVKSGVKDVVKEWGHQQRDACPKLVTHAFLSQQRVLLLVAAARAAVGCGAVALATSLPDCFLSCLSSAKEPCPNSLKSSHMPSLPHPSCLLLVLLISLTPTSCSLPHPHLASNYPRVVMSHLRPCAPGRRIWWTPFGSGTNNAS